MSSETSLRVVVRARPMNARETKEGARRCIEYYENTNQIVINGAAAFTFDHVFPDTVDQETVYDASAKPLLDRVFNGFNATVLAYGQTGSGKTYTMGTEDNDGTDELRKGIIPRLVDNLFQRIMSTPAPDSYKISVSMYEVYGEFVFDLLRPDKVKLNVHGDEKNCTIVNLTAVPVTDLKGALKQLATGCHYRTKAETAMNAMSSRSHAVFTIYVEKTAVPDDDQAFTAKLQLVDLAGSERLKKTEAEGNRMKEGININAGLLILSQVIAALATKQRHVPYRNSTITRVLQDSLGGNSYTVFLACISPADTNSQETLNTLRYADRAKQIKNKPIVNKNPKAEEISILRAQIKRLEKENTDLRNGISPVDTKVNDIVHVAKIASLKDELAKKDDEVREKCIKMSEIIIKMNSFSQRIIRLEAENKKLNTLVNGVRALYQNEEMQELSEMVQNIQQLLESDPNESSVQQDDENGDESQIGVSGNDEIYDAERLPELQEQLDELEKQIAMKDENRQKAIETQREFIEVLQQREDEKTQLVVRVGELENEISKLRSETKKASTASKLAEERRQKLKELERQHAEHKKTLLEFKKLQDTRKKMEDALKKTEEELKNLKLQRIRLVKEQRAEASKFNAYKLKHEREMAQIKSRMQKTEMNVARQKRMDDQKLAVLQQRLAESTRANKALKDLNNRRALRKESPTDSTALQTMIEEELELEAASHRCQTLCVELRRQRGEIQQQIDQLEAERFESRKGRSVSADPDCTVPLEGEEEFENDRQRKLDELRSSLDEINSEIQDLLKNSTISEDNKGSQKTSKWEKVPIEIRPLFEAIYNQALLHLKKEIDFEFKMTKQKNDFKSKLASKMKQEEKRKRDEEEMKRKFTALSEQLEKAKADLHPQIAFLLQLIKEKQVDEAALNRFESLRNTYCDVEQKIKKARRRTTNFSGGLTPKPELKRNERTRRAVARYGNVVNPMDVTIDESFHDRKNHVKPSQHLNQLIEGNIRKRIALSPIKMGDDTRLTEEDEMDFEQENAPANTTIIIKGKSESPINSTFVINSHSPSSSSAALDDMAPPIRRRSRRTDLGPL